MMTLHDEITELLSEFYDNKLTMLEISALANLYLANSFFIKRLDGAFKWL